MSDAEPSSDPGHSETTARFAVLSERVKTMQTTIERHIDEDREDRRETNKKLDALKFQVAAFTGAVTLAATLGGWLVEHFMGR